MSSKVYFSDSTTDVTNHAISTERLRKVFNGLQSRLNILNNSNNSNKLARNLKENVNLNTPWKSTQLLDNKIKSEGTKKPRHKITKVIAETPIKFGNTGTSYSSLPPPSSSSKFTLQAVKSITAVKNVNLNSSLTSTKSMDTNRSKDTSYTIESTTSYKKYPITMKKSAVIPKSQIISKIKVLKTPVTIRRETTIKNPFFEDESFPRPIHNATKKDPDFSVSQDMMTNIINNDGEISLTSLDIKQLKKKISPLRPADNPFSFIK